MIQLHIKLPPSHTVEIFHVQFEACNYCELVQETEEKPSKGSSAKVKGGPAGDRTSKKGKVTPAVDVDKFPMPQKGSTILKKRGDDLESQYIGRKSNNDYTMWGA